MQNEVRYIDRGVEHVGTYKVEGWMLELSCAYGTCRVALGLFEPKALARKLLRVLVAKAERVVVAAAPHPAAIEAAKTGLPASARKS